MNIYFRTLLIISLVSVSINQAKADSQSRWYIAPVFGLSQLSDVDAQANDVFNTSGKTEISLDSGFLAGAALGYSHNERWSTELGWEYRSNASSLTLPNGQQFEDGNYASNTFFLNGKYEFSKTGRTNGPKWRPFVGAGLVWVQEVDIDLESQEQEFSYSASGDLGFQVLGGVIYRLNDALDLEAALRYTAISGIDLEPEQRAQGDFSNLEYKPISAQLALKYRF